MVTDTDTHLNLRAELERRILAKLGTSVDIDILLRQCGDILEVCAEMVLEACPDMAVAATCVAKPPLEFSIIVKEGETFDSLIALGNYGSKWAQITEKRFPVRLSPAGERKLALLHFGHEITCYDAIAEAAKQGLERPTIEDCLRFGAQHSEVLCQFPVVFLHVHVPVRGLVEALRLDFVGSKRSIQCPWFASNWRDDCRFAFVRK